MIALISAPLTAGPAQAADGDLQATHSDIDDKSFTLKYQGDPVVRITQKGSATIDFNELASANANKNNTCSVIRKYSVTGSDKLLSGTRVRDWGYSTDTKVDTTCLTSHGHVNGQFRRNIYWAGKYKIDRRVAKPGLSIVITGGYNVDPGAEEYIVQIQKTGSWTFRKPSKSKDSGSNKNKDSGSNKNKGNRGGADHGGSGVEDTPVLPPTGTPALPGGRNLLLS